MNRLVEPNDGDANNSNSFDKGRNRIGDGRGGGKDDKCDYVLGIVNGAVHEEIVAD